VSADIKISHDLRSLFGPVRDQGPRPTCLAFAASDAHAGVRPGWDPLSCEFAFYRAQQRGGRPPTVGATLGHMLDALRFDGQPYEAGWPYLPATPANGSAWLPPASPGALFGREGAQNPASFAAACAHLAAGSAVMMLMMLSASFFSPAAGVVAPASGEAPQAAVRHAVIGVACGQVDGEEAILVRNSWGAGWGVEGHAWLTESFVAPRLFALATLGGDVHVPSYCAAA
jgi:hypothetical protein